MVIVSNKNQRYAVLTKLHTIVLREIERDVCKHECEASLSQPSSFDGLPATRYSYIIVGVSLCLSKIKSFLFEIDGFTSGC